jgi:hypothetical protein
MGNVAVTRELAGADELEELYKLDASETGPESEPDEDEDTGEDQDTGDDDDEEFKPGDMPHP